MSSEIANRQTAVQLVGPDELVLNHDKAVPVAGPYQILARIEAVGLCFSDLKLLKQFSSHARKSKIISGIDKEILKEIPSYVPDDTPTVPGHESVVRVCAVGEKVKDVTLGGRYLVQTDYRWLPTKNSVASFGYNFEGALQQYVLMDNRVITSPQGDSMLVPASDGLSASAIALVEPWGCVEDAYAVRQRSSLKVGGKMLVVADVDIKEELFSGFLNRFGLPGQVTLLCGTSELSGLNLHIVKIDDISQANDSGYDDVIYFGSNPRTIEAVFSKISSDGLLNIVLCGGRFGRDVAVEIGRVHYGNTRIIGSIGYDPAESMSYIPVSGEILKASKINVTGAAGPMGLMHVVRNICRGLEDITVFAGDIDDQRLGFLKRIAEPLAEKNGVRFVPYNSAKDSVKEAFDYVVLMVPVPQLVSDSVNTAAENAIINIFAGIPANVKAEINLDAYIEKRLYFIGTSGSTLGDMKAVLKKVESGSLDTNISVAAVSGLAGAIDGIRAIENRLVPGKIVVYPACEDLPLITLEKMKEYFPEVEKCLENGLWNHKAEETLLELAKK